MDYKVGDKVRIKTWESMKRKYGLVSFYSIIKTTHHFIWGMEESINQKFPERILTIEEIRSGSLNDCYIMKNICCKWTDDMIEGLYEEPIYKPITSRFEILDL